MNIHFGSYVYFKHPGVDEAAKLDKRFEPLRDLHSSGTMTKPLEGGKTMVSGYNISNRTNLLKALGELVDRRIPFVYDPTRDFNQSREVAMELSRNGLFDRIA